LTDLEILQHALAEGYHVIGFIDTLEKLQNSHTEYLRTGYQAQSIDSFISVFDIQVKKEALLDPRNKDKFLVILKKSTNQFEIVTSDMQCVEKARQQQANQNEGIGISIMVECSASGGSSDPNQVTHVSQITSQLQGFWGWTFKDTGIGKFNGNKTIESINESDAKRELEKLQHVLNYISITQQIGIRIERYGISKIPRFGVIYGVCSPTEYNVPPLSVERIKKFEKFLTLPKETLEVADGINQTYLLTSVNSRLALLWAITEAVFYEKPTLLLYGDEAKAILEHAREITTLKGEGERRFLELESLLNNPDRLPLKSRNKRISERIANALAFNEQEVYEEIKHASRVRGKYLHELKSDIQGVRQAENFLRATLEKYLEKQLSN